MNLKSFWPLLMAALLVGGCATSPVPTTSPADVGETRPGSGYLKGYLAQAEQPDSLALLPPPPEAGSAALAADVAAFRSLTALQGTPRGALAVRDANLRFPQAASTFSCALGVQISEQRTPHLNMLLRRTLADAGGATYKAKEKYQRTRPFVMLKTGSCTPKEEAHLAKDGSYPSGHSALGWAWALVLTEIAPERTDALLQRGRAFAQSRGICGVHWRSDIEAGRLIGAATVSRLHANPVFTAQMAAARQEVAQARSRADSAPPAAECTAEASVISGAASLAP
ncbi:acid phosphatase [Acidovorax cavernicola]|uniref:Acid phosphatase n=1 Tax=Acidovorax cavernicola TaxID=1675792 RepID=A0A9X8D467_9BURK|nr:phosphatase PAP2 family protein [Acidovorax cavernicola]RIX79061.1 phosphatase PAP2 family protein [Acidovorax cavernicola]